MVIDIHVELGKVPWKGQSTLRVDCKIYGVLAQDGLRG